jgi:SAM-dependent methyltransferase
VSPAARYDDTVAEWYDALVTGPAPSWLATALRMLLGDGRGRRCLDLGCGGGVRARLLGDLGWQVVGLDLAPAQLRIARGSGRLRAVACADAAVLPLRDGRLDAVASFVTHTDFDDWSAAVGEVARVLTPGGTFAYIGVHPCFVGPFAEALDDGTRQLHAGYADTALRFDGPGLGDGLRSRVGVRHLPLSGLLNPVHAAGLRLGPFAELGDGLLPGLLGFAATKTAT